MSPSVVPPSVRRRDPSRWTGAGIASRHARERWIGALLIAASTVSILTTVGIVGVLVYESLGFFADVSLRSFLTGTQWTPLF
jgi:ABC-type phosphate transport system permease subunit